MDEGNQVESLTSFMRDLRSGDIIFDPVVVEYTTVMAVGRPRVSYVFKSMTLEVVEVSLLSPAGKVHIDDYVANFSVKVHRAVDGREGGTT